MLQIISILISTWHRNPDVHSPSIPIWWCPHVQYRRTWTADAPFGRKYCSDLPSCLSKLFFFRIKNLKFKNGYKLGQAGRTRRFVPPCQVLCKVSGPTLIFNFQAQVLGFELTLMLSPSLARQFNLYVTLRKFSMAGYNPGNESVNDTNLQ